MVDGYTTLNPGVGGDVMDETDVIYGSGPPVRKRPRVVLTGEGADDIVETTDSIPTGYERGLVVREGSRGQQPSEGSIPIVMASDQMIGKSVVVVFQHSVGTTQSQLPDNAIGYSVTLKSMNNNSSVIYVGVSGVTPSSGFELSAGESVSLSVDNTNRLYVVASDINQKVCVIGI